MPTGNVHFCRSSVNINDFEQVFGKRLNYSTTVQFVQQVMKKGNHWFYGNVSFSKTFKNLFFPEKVVLFYSGLNFFWMEIVFSSPVLCEYWRCKGYSDYCAIHFSSFFNFFSNEIIVNLSVWKWPQLVVEVSCYTTSIVLFVPFDLWYLLV